MDWFSNEFIYSGASIDSFKSGKFSRSGGFSIFDPGPSIDILNTIEKTEDKEIAFFSGPVFKLINSLVAPTFSDLIEEKSSRVKVEEKTLSTGSLSRAKNNNDFVGRELGIENRVKSDIGVDFLGGDLLIIDDSLQIVDYEFDSINTPLEEVIEILQPEATDSNISLDISNEELFKISYDNESLNQYSVEELVASHFKYQL